MGKKKDAREEGKQNNLLATTALVAPYIERITAAWGETVTSAQKTLASAIKTGQEVQRTKDDLPYGLWVMVKTTQLPFEARMAEKLMAIAGNKVIRDTVYTPLLPPSWDTVYELTRLDKKLGPNTLKAKLDAGEITPKTTKRQVVNWLRPQSREEQDDKKKKKNHPPPTSEKRLDYLECLHALSPEDCYAELVTLCTSVGRLGQHIAVTPPAPTIEAEAVATGGDTPTTDAAKGEPHNTH